ncbi:uncharacterized protein LOC131247061 [Magnolia sinica]|uniref:uncharacterized protein LOC131247061 n=1 Tax=Magnolia sinica TaxID=86752 RepID=UPI00265A6E38|nr:uncharacterized protein LOC131247061 [Magnolia sinica]
MQDPEGNPACFSPHDRLTDDPAAATKSGQSVVMSVYQTKITGQCRSVTVTWCKSLLVHGLSISVQGSDNQSSCKVELKPWSFWRKQGSKRFYIDGKPVDVFWDLKAVKFGREPEPQSDYYVAVVCEEEVVLLLGDLKKEAYRKTGSRPALIDASLVLRKEHIFGKKRFSTRAKFHEKGKNHGILIECSNNNTKRSNCGSSNSWESIEPEMVIRIDGHLAIHVKHLQWKFRGNESISIDKFRVEVYWDVHDWLFIPGLQHALFVFKPMSSSPSLPLSSSSLSSSMTPDTLSSSQTACSSLIDANSVGGPQGFCLYLYAWMLE